MRVTAPQRAVGQQALTAVSGPLCMPEEQVFSTEQELDRAAMATELRWLADAVETGEVTPEGEAPIALPERCRYEFELERLTSSETGEVRRGGDPLANLKARNFPKN